MFFVLDFIFRYLVYWILSDVVFYIISTSFVFFYLVRLYKVFYVLFMLLLIVIKYENKN